MSPEDWTIHICYAFSKATMTWWGELMRLDFFIIIIGILLVVAMVLTLLYGGKYSRHGYGSKVPATQIQPLG